MADSSTSALAALVREVKRQRDVLADATERDDAAIAALEQDRAGTRNRVARNGWRRRWTRTDARLFDTGRAWFDDGGTWPRTSRLLARYWPVGGQPKYKAMLRAATDEARAAGRLADIIDYVTTLDSAHAAYLHHVGELSGRFGRIRDYTHDYRHVEQLHAAAVEQVTAAIPELQGAV